MNMKNQAIEGMKGACLLGALVGVVAGCGGANTAQGSEPAKTTAAPASSGSAAPAAGTAPGGAPGPEQIGAVLKDHSRELKVCYERDRDRGMIYKGETKFRVKLDPGGKVQDVQGVDVTPQAEFLTACVSESMKGWTFPPSSQGGSVTFAVPWR
jgi:outer membrane biosynthesis protein TonB